MTTYRRCSRGRRDSLYFTRRETTVLRFISKLIGRVSTPRAQCALPGLFTLGKVGGVETASLMSRANKRKMFTIPFLCTAAPRRRAVRRVAGTTWPTTTDEDPKLPAFIVDTHTHKHSTFMYTYMFFFLLLFLHIIIFFNAPECIIFSLFRRVCVHRRRRRRRSLFPFPLYNR